MTDERPLLFVTNYAPTARVGAFAELARREEVEFALFGGRLRHGGREPAQLPFPHCRIAQRDVRALASGGSYRAVVAGTVGRTALPAAYLGARQAGLPFVLWATLWEQPAGPAGLAGYPLVRWIYGRADAVATYGPHVSAYVRHRGARNVFEAPQAVDNAFWSAPGDGEPARLAPFQVVFAGRLELEKGLAVLLAAWRQASLDARDCALVLVGGGTEAKSARGAVGVHLAGEAGPERVRSVYAGSDVCVVPSIPTRTFREPWGLAVNEAMNQGLPVVASDAVGAAAGGLVRHERNGLVVPAADPQALAGALRRLCDEPELRRDLGATARRDVAAYSPIAWAEGFSRALAAAGSSRAPVTIAT